MAPLLHVRFVMSSSMEPALPLGSLIVAVRQEAYVAGQVIVFKTEKGEVVHRIHHISQTCIETKGDANTSGDSDCLQNGDILGLVVSTVPYLGFIPGYAQQILAHPSL